MGLGAGSAGGLEEAVAIFGLRDRVALGVTRRVPLLLAMSFRNRSSGAAA